MNNDLLIIGMILTPVVLFIIICWVFGGKEVKKADVISSNIDDEIYRKLILDSFKKMDGRRFEQFTYELFKMQGLEVKLTPASCDKGIDVIVGGMGVECKLYAKNNPVGYDILTKLMGSLIVNGLDKGMIVTTGRFTTSCINNCPENIGLWDTDDILDECMLIKDRVKFIEYLGYSIFMLERKGVIDRSVVARI